MGIAKRLATSLLVLAASHTNGQDAPWIEYSEGANGTKYYMHRDRVKRISDSTVQVWTKGIPPKAKSVFLNKATPTYVYTVANLEVNCLAETSRFSVMYYHAKDGSVAHTDHPTDPHLPAAPDTVAESAIRTACNLLQHAKR